MWAEAGQTTAAVGGTEGSGQALVQLYGDIIARLPSIGIGLAILLILFFISGPLASFILKPFNYITQSPLIRSVSRRVLSALIILLGAYLFLKLAGLTEFAVAIISGTGLLGLILGFAFRDIAENFISSLLLTVQRPFRIGDVVEVDNYLGVVQKVTARATTLVDFDGNHIQIPNATIYKGVIKNLTANPNMRGHFVIGVGYDCDVKQAQQLATSVIRAHQDILDNPEPQVLVDNLGSATLNLKVYFWIDVEKTSVLKMASVLMRELVSAFDEAGISMPDDAREVIFPQGIPGIRKEDANAEADHTQPQESQHAVKNTARPDNAADANAPPTPRQSVPAPATSAALPDSNTAPASRQGSAAKRKTDDVSSETGEIRRQAAQARDPEDGNNIL